MIEQKIHSIPPSTSIVAPVGAVAIAAATALAAPYFALLSKFFGHDSKNPVLDVTNRVNAIASLTSAEEKDIAKAFLSAKITRQNITKMNDNDIFVPLDVILTRPWMTYKMSSVIVMKAGKETGETIIGQQDFQMSSNTQDRTLEASYMYYGKAIVKKSRNVIVAPRVFCQGYISGNNTEYVTMDTIEKQISQRSGIFEGRESLLSLLVTVGGMTIAKNWIDIRGTNNNTGAKTYHGSQEFYHKLLNIDDLEIASPTEDFIDYEDMAYAANTICWLGHIEYGDPTLKLVNLNTGHLGPNTYGLIILRQKLVLTFSQ